MGVHVLESLFYRFFFGFLFMMAWLLMGPGLASVKTKRLPSHLGRSLVGIVSMAFGFWAVTLLPLPELASISFSSPLIVTVLSIVLLGEVVGRRRWAAMIIGFIGVLIVVKPDANGIDPKGAIVALSGVVLTAYTFILIKKLSTTESSTSIVFWYTALSTPIAAIALMFVGSTHPPIIWLMMIGIGLLGAFGQITLSESIKYAPMSVVSPMDYSNLLWSTLYGYLIWDYWPGASMWIGAPIIIGAGLYIAMRERTLKTVQS